MLTKSCLLVPRQWTRLCPSPGSCSREVSSCLPSFLTGWLDERTVDWRIGGDLVACVEGTRWPRCAPHSLELLLLKALLSLVTSRHLCSFLVVVVSSCLFCPVLCESAVPLVRPPRAHDNSENSQAALSLSLYHWHRLPLSLSVLFLSWLPLSVTSTQWQNRTLAVGAGLPVLAPPPPLPVPPPSL